jgi:hypothetical protein
MPVTWWFEHPAVVPVVVVAAVVWKCWPKKEN